METIELKPIAHIETDFGTKFGIPRQAGLVEELKGRIVFEPEFRREEALRGIDAFTHIWLIWQFSENAGKEWTPTVRPPRLGGNTRMGVWATRSPFRPNALGLSCVRLEGLERDGERGMTLLVAGADLMNGTPIFDIKPYIPYSDLIPDAGEGFAPRPQEALEVILPPEAAAMLPKEKREALKSVLRCDPRPHYQKDPERVYGMEFAGKNVRFRVEDETVYVLSVEDVK